MHTPTISPPTAAIVAVCDAIDEAISSFLDARASLRSSRYEADVEAVNLLNLVIRHIEGVIALARTDLVLVPPAQVSARAAFETAIKAAWMVDADDPFAREARWLAHLAEEERVYQRVASRSEDPQAMAAYQAHVKVMGEFREGVAALLPPHVQQLRGNPSLEEMSRYIGGERLYSLYIYLSQFVHGGHVATALYRKHLGTKKQIGEFVGPPNWYIPFRLCWLSLSHPGNIVLTRVSGAPTQFFSESQEAAILRVIEAIKS